MPKNGQRQARLPIYDEPPKALRPRTPEAPAGGDAKRRSWADIVAENEDAATTVTDVSVGFGSRAGADSAMGNRRQSWLNLMESDDNLHKTDFVSANPAGRSGQPTQPRAIAAGSLRDSSISSRTSEFILVPQEYVSASKLALADTRLPPSQYHVAGDTVDLQRPTGHRRPIGEHCCGCSSRRLCWLVAAVLLIVCAVVAGLVIRSLLQAPKIYEFDWVPPSYAVSGNVDTTSHVTVRIENDFIAGFSLDDVVLFGGTVDSVANYRTSTMVSDMSDLPNYCFIRTINTTALPSIEDVRLAAENTLESTRQESGWIHDWRWTAEPLLLDLRHLLLESNERQCGDSHLVRLKRADSDMRYRGCARCHKYCLPDFGIERTSWGGVETPRLNVLRQQCFWLYVAELDPTVAAADLAGYERLFRQFYTDRRTPSTTPSTDHWIDLDVGK